MVRIVWDSSVQIRPFWTDLDSYERFRFEEHNFRFSFCGEHVHCNLILFFFSSAQQGVDKRTGEEEAELEIYDLVDNYIYFFVLFLLPFFRYNFF